MLIKLLLAPMESRCTLINPLPRSSNELRTVASQPVHRLMSVSTGVRFRVAFLKLFLMRVTHKRALTQRLEACCDARWPPRGINNQFELQSLGAEIGSAEEMLCLR